MNSNTERIQSALAFISAHERDTWLRMGMAVKSELGNDGFSIWDEWSQQGESYNTKDAWATWKSIRPHGKVTGGSLFYEAQKNGWPGDDGNQMPSSAGLAGRQRVAAVMAVTEEAEIERERDETAKKAEAILKAATKVGSNQPYLSRKKVSPLATLLEIDAGAAAAVLGYRPKSGGDLLVGRLLVVPVRQGDRISTVELIDGEGRKAALSGRGSKVGGYWATERLHDGIGLSLMIGEGVATVLSAMEATRHPAVAALTSSNLLVVAKEMRVRYPAAVLVILADLVKATGTPDPHAIEAARAACGLLAIPDFGIDRDATSTDFNDMAAIFGNEAVGRAIANATAPAKAELQTVTDNAIGSISDGWPLPQPFSLKIKSEPYPVDALPDTIRAAVEEVADFVKAPVPMVASSALAALSLAIQAYTDAKRAEMLQGPVGLFLLTIADSGERKSTCDGFFTKAIRGYEAHQAEAGQHILKDYKAAISAWEAERDGILSAIKQAGRVAKPVNGKDIKMLRAELVEHQHQEPVVPKIPRLIYADATPEALAYGLAHHWPSGGVVSAEGGIVFGSHGMGKDSVMRNLAMLNQLWDGNNLTIDRRTTESFTVKGARLTVALQVQEPTLREFFKQSGVLARGSGFLARFLVAWPESTQGFRPFTEAPANWPHLSAFNQRITEILEQPVTISEDGMLTPAMLSLTKEAKDAWVQYHNAIEVGLSSGGELYDVRDVASKSADNAARLAALFHMFNSKNSKNSSSNIQNAEIESATRIVAWYLNESKRFFGELALPVELSNAARLDEWLINHCRKMHTHFVGKNHTRQYGPIRNGKSLDAAIDELVSLDRISVCNDGKLITIKVNSALLLEAVQT